jgi:hypothetical protein
VILGVNDGAGNDQFPWIPLLLFILLSLFCTDMVRTRRLAKPVTRPCQIVTRYEYLRGVISDFFKVEVFRGDSCMVAVLDQLLTQEVAEVDRRISEIQGLEQKLSRISKRSEILSQAEILERSLGQSSVSAEIADSVTRMQRLADEARQFTAERKFWHLKEVTYLAVRELTDYRKSFGSSAFIHVPDSVFDALKKGLETHEESLKRIKKSVAAIGSAFDISEMASRRDLEGFALNTEILAEEIEDNFEFLGFDLLEALHAFFQEIVIKSRDKQSLQSLQGRRAEARRRLRFAAGFILNLVETAREDIQTEDDELNLLYLQAGDLTAEC